MALNGLNCAAVPLTIYLLTRLLLIHFGWNRWHDGEVESQ